MLPWISVYSTSLNNKASCSCQQRRPYFYAPGLFAPFGINDFPREVKLKDDTLPALSDFPLYSLLKQKLRLLFDAFAQDFRISLCTVPLKLKKTVLKVQFSRGENSRTSRFLPFSSFRLGKRRIQPRLKRQISSTVVSATGHFSGDVRIASSRTVCLNDTFADRAPGTFTLNAELL